MRLVPWTEWGKATTYGKYYILQGNKPIGRAHRRFVKEHNWWRWHIALIGKPEVTMPEDATYASVIEELLRWA